MARPLTPLGSLGAKVAESFDDDGGARKLAISQEELLFLANAMQRTASVRSPFGEGFALSLAAAVCVSLVSVVIALRTPALF